MTNALPRAPAEFPNTVLLVDDEEVVVDVLSKVLARAELPFQAVTSGKEALALLERQPFGCLVTDKNLPDVNGLEVLRAARRLQPFCACIMITGYSTTESVLEVLRMGASDYLEKPFPDLKLVLQRVQTAMAHQRVEFERNTLVEALRTMQSSVEQISAEAFAQKTQRELLETVLDLRIEEATSSLRRQVEVLESTARAERELTRALTQKLTDCLDYLRNVQDEADALPSLMRGVLRELERRIEESEGLLRENLEDAEA